MNLSNGFKYCHIQLHMMRLTQSKLLWQTTRRNITLDMKMSNDPYYVLGVDREAKFSEVKK